ncbi:hypothetical protein [Aureisphaera sp.]
MKKRTLSYTIPLAFAFFFAEGVLGKHSVFFRMNFDSNQLAMLQNIQLSTLKKIGNRLWKKLSLDTTIHLDNFLSSF